MMIEPMDIQAVESKLNDVTVTAIPMTNKSNNNNFTLQQSQLSPPVMVTTRVSADITTPLTSVNSIPSSITTNSGLSKYAQLLAVIEEMERDIRPTYSGSRSSAERLKRGIVHARILVRECLLETERSARQ